MLLLLLANQLQQLGINQQQLGVGLQLQVVQVQQLAGSKPAMSNHSSSDSSTSTQIISGRETMRQQQGQETQQGQVMQPQ